MLEVDRVEGRLYSYPEVFAPKNEGSRPLFWLWGKRPTCCSAERGGRIASGEIERPGQPLRSTKTYHRRGMRGIKGPPDIIVTIFITIIILVSVLVSILVLTWLRRLRQVAIWTFGKNLDIWALHYVQNGLLTHWSNVQIWRSKWGWKYKASGLGLKWKEVFSLHNMKSKRCWKYNQNFA